MAGVSLAGCLDRFEPTTSRSGDESVGIGVLVPDAAEGLVGRSMRRMGTVLEDELNATGGIDGRDVEVLVAGTQSSPLVGRRSYQELLLEEDVDVTTGIYTSDVLEHVIEDVAEQETLHLTAGAATADASRLLAEAYDDYRYHFRVGPINEVHLARAQLEFVTEMAAEQGWESVAVLAEDYDWNRTPYRRLVEELPEQGVDVALATRYSPTMEDFSALFDRVEAADADMAFLLAAHGGDAALFHWKFSDLTATEPSPREFAFGGVYVPIQHPLYHESTGGISEYAITNTGRRTESELQRVAESPAERYREAHGLEPMHQSYLLYDAVTLFAEVVERTGTLESEALVDELEGISVTGTTGPIEFYGPDAEFPHDRVYDRDVTTYIQWQESDDVGRQEIIWPEEHATSEYATPPWLATDEQSS